MTLLTMVLFMYRFILILAIALTGLIIIWHQAACGKNKSEGVGLPRPTGFWDIVSKLVHLIMFLCFVVLALTGFYPGLILGRQITGYPLMLHVTMAPVFMLGMVALAVLWAARCQFNEADWNLIRRLWSKQARQEGHACQCTFFLQKICFWVMILLAIPAGLTIVLSMLPLFGTHGQELMYHTHRYVTIFLTMAGILFCYLVAFSWTRQN